MNREIAVSASSAAQQAQSSAAVDTSKTLLCTSLTAATVDGMLAEAQEAVAAGADIVELRLDYLENFDAQRDLPPLVTSCPLPVIVTYRPDWEG